MAAIQHSALTSIHKFAYVDSVDPGAVGAYKGWIDTSTNPYKLRMRNSLNNGWINVGIWSQTLVDIGNLTPSDDDLLQYVNGAWTNTNLATIKAEMSLNNVPNIDARARSTHTGTQLASTISDFTSAVDARISSQIKTSYLENALSIQSDSILDDTLLSVNLDPYVKYAYRVELYHYTTGNVVGGGVKFELHSYPSVISSSGAIETRDNSGFLISNQNAPANTIFTASPVGPSVTTLWGVLETTTLGEGVVSLKAAQSSSNSTVLNIRAGSNMVFTRIAPNVPIPYDASAQTFFTAAGITNPTQMSAVNQLVLDLKAYSLWTKITAIYPFVGGTANSHKYNLKDPRDVDAAFRIVFGGAVTHNANGITGDGSTGYGDTKIVCDTNTALNNVHMSVYCRTIGGNADNMYELSASGGGSTAMTLTLKNQSSTGPTIGQMYRSDDGAAFVVKNDMSAQGFWMLSRRASNDFSGYKNGTSFQNQTATNTGARPSRSLFILANNYSGGTLYYSNRNLALVSVGTSLTDTEVTNFNTAVQAYQTTLSRQV